MASIIDRGTYYVRFDNGVSISRAQVNGNWRYLRWEGSGTGRRLIGLIQNTKKAERFFS